MPAVLLVEDNDINIMLMLRFLRRLGLEATVAVRDEEIVTIKVDGEESVAGVDVLGLEAVLRAKIDIGAIDLVVIISVVAAANVDGIGDARAIKVGEDTVLAVRNGLVLVRLGTNNSALQIPKEKSKE